LVIDARTTSGKSANHAKEKDGKIDSENDYQAAPTTVGKSHRNPKTKRVYKSTPAKPKPATPAERDDDLDNLQGTWKMVGAEYDGKKANSSQELWKISLGGEDDGDKEQKYPKEIEWVFKNDQYTIIMDGHQCEVWDVRLNSSKDPKTIDSDPSIGRVNTNVRLTGIYELTGDRLRICFDLTARGRPDNFKAAKGSRRVYYVFERQ
jgi:uncharacterized protein (TIGR03067 family)